MTQKTPYILTFCKYTRYFSLIRAHDLTITYAQLGQNILTTLAGQALNSFRRKGFSRPKVHSFGLEGALLRCRKPTASDTKTHCFGVESPLLRTRKPTASDTKTQCFSSTTSHLPTQMILVQVLPPQRICSEHVSEQMLS